MVTWWFIAPKNQYKVCSRKLSWLFSLQISRSPLLNALEVAPGPFNLLPSRMLLLRTSAPDLSSKGDSWEKVILTPDRDHDRVLLCALFPQTGHAAGSRSSRLSFFWDSTPGKTGWRTALLSLRIMVEKPLEEKLCPNSGSRWNKNK